MTDESVFFQSEGITVTNARFVVGAQTFAIRGITSVQGVMTPPPRAWPVVLALIGITVAVSGFQGSLVVAIFGLLILAVGIWIWIIQKPTFSVILTTASGSVTAYESKDKDYISQIIRALNDSIVSHG